MVSSDVNNFKRKVPSALTNLFGGATPDISATPRPIKQEKSILKVAVLNEPYFPKQKLSVRFNAIVLQHMELEDFSEGADPKAKQGGIAQGQQFGIVQKMEKSFRSFAKYGTVCEIVSHESTPSISFNPYERSQNQSGGNTMVQAMGSHRFRIDRVLHRALDGLILTCEVTNFHEEGSDLDAKLAASPLFAKMKEDAVEYCRVSEQIANKNRANVFKQKTEQLNQISSASEMTFFICQLLSSPMKSEFQAILNENNIEQRMKIVADLIAKEVQLKLANVAKIEALKKRIKERASQFGGENANGQDEAKNEVEEMREKLQQLELPEETKIICDREIKKLKQLGPKNQEYHVSMNYLQTISELPWNISQEENLDPAKAQEVLERDHYGLEQIKQRIIQFLAVRKLTKDNQGSILCFYGPPGVGKTSLGKSIAEALNRKFYRVALGGVRDEAEIRGHRRTYVGSMPGVIVSSLKKIGTNNPVFLLDEIDKMGKDARGDPGAALLEVLDPAQNNKFTDHFLSTPFDLSKIMFIATANSLETIHPALLDRMEVIDLSGYSIDEKLQIAKQYLVPRQIKQNGITADVIEIGDQELKTVITDYTMESGVRNLERSIGSICRVVAYRYATAENTDSFEKVVVDNSIIQEALGNKKIDSMLHERITKPGVAIGLAYTSVGGRCLLIETTKFPGSGQITLTGQLGDVMKESIGTSLSWIKTNAIKMGLTSSQKAIKNHDVVRVVESDSPVVTRNAAREVDIERLMKNWDLHVHFPAASTPKDGPSAGVTITVALVSLFCGRRVRSDFAMTGEISLQGLVLPVGGIKEKVMAAHRNGQKHVILPKKNEQDLEDVPEDLRREITVHFVTTIEEALNLALEDEIDSDFFKNDLLPTFRPKL